MGPIMKAATTVGAGFATGGLSTALQVAGTAFTLFSGIQQAGAIKAQGKQQAAIANMQAEQTRLVAERNALIIRDQAKYKAERLTEKGKREQASAQRKFIEQRRRTKLAESKFQAIAGASGGGVGDPTNLNLMAQLEAEGQFAEESALYEGESAASLLTSQAALALYEGEQSAEMAEYTGESQAQLREYEGASAKYSADVGARTTLVSTIGKTAISAGTLMSKYAPAPSAKDITAAPTGTYSPSYGTGMLTTGYY